MVSLPDCDKSLEAARKLPSGTGVMIFPDPPPKIVDLRSMINERLILSKDERNN